MFSVNASVLTQGVIIGPDPESSTASNYSENFVFDVSATATYPLGAPKSSVLSEGVNVDMIPSIDGIEFASELQVDNWFSVSDIITLKDEKTKSSSLKIPQNSIFEVKPANGTEYISLNDASITLSEEQILSDGAFAIFKKTGNFVGTANILFETTTTSKTLSEEIDGVSQTSSIDFEFNVEEDLIQLYESSNSTQILDDALINDGRTDTGTDISFNISISEFSSVDILDNVGISITGTSIVDGTQIIIDSETVYTAQEIGKDTGAFSDIYPRYQ